VIGSKATCVAAHSSDTVPMLVALGAHLCFTTGDGSVEVSLRDLFGKDGRPERHKSLPAEALLTHVVVPATAVGLRTSFHKLRQRDSIDFAQLNLGVAVRLNDDLVQSIEVVFSGLLPRPKVLRKLQVAHGRPLDDALIAELEGLAYKQVRPQSSRDGDVTYRRKMARVLLRRALHDVRA
jgi:xanthine dehydrogenase YagS FAD-binding subunit